MNSPRYRVKTLILATTLAAVALACLAPWLRTLTPVQLIGIVGRMLFLVIGVLIGGQLSLFIYRRYARRERAAELGVKSRCVRVRPEPLVWFIAAFVWAVAIFMEVAFGDLYRSPRAVGKYSHHLMMWIWWFNVGQLSGRCIVSWFGLNRPVYLTPAWLISPWVCHPWRRGFEYGWRDRSAGQLFLIAPHSYRFELSIPPEKVDEVDQMLEPLLDPPKYRPPVVPPPPPT